jgi:2'-5' RNA ligase
MRLLLAVQLVKNALPEAAALLPKLSALLPDGWLTKDELAVRLLDFGEVEQGYMADLFFAVDKAAAAHQGFSITLQGLAFVERLGKPKQAYLAVRENAGMLQALTFSVLRWLPPQIRARYDEPWRPMLLLGRLQRTVDQRLRLQLQAAVAQTVIAMNAREVAVLGLQDDALVVQHTAKLPG